MGGYAEHRFGKTLDILWRAMLYSISLIIANIAIAVSAVGYGAAFFGVDLNATQTSPGNNCALVVCSDSRTSVGIVSQVDSAI